MDIFDREAQPFDRLREAHSFFLQRISKRTKPSSLVKVLTFSNKLAFGFYFGIECKFPSVQVGEALFVNPWETSTVDGLILKIKPQLLKYDVSLINLFFIYFPMIQSKMSSLSFFLLCLQSSGLLCNQQSLPLQSQLVFFAELFKK